MTEIATWLEFEPPDLKKRELDQEVLVLQTLPSSGPHIEHKVQRRPEEGAASREKDLKLYKRKMNLLTPKVLFDSTQMNLFIKGCDLQPSVVTAAHIPPAIFS